MNKRELLSLRKEITDIRDEMIHLDAEDQKLLYNIIFKTNQCIDFLNMKIGEEEKI